MKYFWFILLYLPQTIVCQVYSTTEGDLSFVSNAPLEIIKASSNDLQGVLDITKKLFAFKLYIKSFDGFNNPLQKVHFYENYMEADQFPLAFFKGKILEPIFDGKNKYRAKGVLEIHNQKVERIIEVDVDIKKDIVFFNSSFSVPLVDHDIALPRIVYQKIAEIIEVKVSGQMNLRE